ncbi:MAG TPA: tetratricopeptide repeat protein [Candidatus Solibacter sp.]|nr:tetratricopeptide repeat protein [Candidatus Solibacter sp.]
MPSSPDENTLSASDSNSGENPSSIGPYRLIEMVGVGGMGEVWRAEQTEPFHRVVALKLIKQGMDTRTVVARFDSERQALALMEHPNIAKVFDAGITSTGRPYFVMEYVPGRPITDYCDHRQRSIKQRLELFMKVCEGVQHAHQKGIIHRDLKPSNVIVEELDGKAEPKIIDFGLAKAMGARLTDMTLFTEVGGVVGTPDYMSPEQADRNEQNIDTRTDVYSLGAILYELLVGALPFASEEFRGAGLENMLRKIRQEEPLSPSHRARSLGDSSHELATKRREAPESLARHLSGELDWITMKALEKDRARRYSSPSDLAADIQRHLHDLPVLAGPPSAAYRAGKFLYRHRFGAAVACAALLLLIAFAVTMTFQAHRIAKERDRANREAAASKRVSEFMTSMFKLSDPRENRGNTVTAREILDRASQGIRTGLANDPEVQSRMMQVMGGVYDNLGLYPQAQSLLADAVKIRRAVLGPESPDTLSSMESLARVLREEGQYADAEKLQRETLAGRQKILGAEDPDTAIAMSQLAMILYDEGRSAEAEKIAQQGLDIHRRLVGPEDQNTLWAMVILASVYYDENRLPEAEKLYGEALQIRRRLLGSDHPDTLALMDGYATTLAQEHRNDEAEKMLRETLDIRTRVLGPDHRDTLMSMNNLANMLFIEGRYPEADKLERDTLQIQQRVLGPNNPDTAMSMYNLGGIALHKGKPDEAITMLRSAVDHGLAPNIALGMDKDPDLEALHSHPQFAGLIEHAKEHAASVQKPQ